MESVVGLLGELRGVVDRVLACAADAVDGLDGVELSAVVVGLQHERDRLAVATGQVVQRWRDREHWRRDGSLRAAGALGRDCRSSPETAARELRRAAALQRMPHVRAAIVDGRLSMDHLDLLARAATPPRWELFARHEQLLVERCAEQALFDDARRIVAYWCHLADDLLGRCGDRPEPSRLYASRDGVTGEVHLDGLLDPVDGEIVTRELHRLTTEIRREDTAAAITRTPAQVRAAALVRMATRSINATSVTARPLFQVIVGDHTARRLCELASGTVIQPDHLAPHLDHAVVETFLFAGPHVVISKSKRRTFTGALRSAIQVRDRRCQHPSVCPTRAIDADVDHRHPWAHGGETSQANGRVQCAAHNRLPHLHDPPNPRSPSATDRADDTDPLRLAGIVHRVSASDPDHPPS